MADLCRDADGGFSDFDVESILSRAPRRNYKKSLNQAPEFIRRLSGEEHVKEGNDVELEMRVTGWPTPVLRWYKDDEEIFDHPRIHVDSHNDGNYVFRIHCANKGDEAAYRCRATNDEGSTSCTFFLSVKSKPRKKKRGSKPTCRRTVSFPPMFATIIEKVEEEERAAKETARSPPSPLTELYDGLTLKQRHTWPRFLGDWAFVDGVPNRGGSTGSDDDMDYIDSNLSDAADHDDVFSNDVFSNDVSSGDVRPSFYLDVSGNKVEAKEVEQTTVGKKGQNKTEAKPSVVKQALQPDTIADKENTNECVNVKDSTKKPPNEPGYKQLADNTKLKRQTSPEPKGILKKNKEEAKQEMVVKKPKLDDTIVSKKDTKPKGDESLLSKDTKSNVDGNVLSKDTKAKVNDNVLAKDKRAKTEDNILSKKEVSVTKENNAVKITENKVSVGKAGAAEKVKLKPVKTAGKIEDASAKDPRFSKQDANGKFQLKAIKITEKKGNACVGAVEGGKPTEREKIKLKSVTAMRKDEKPVSPIEEGTLIEGEKVKLKTVTQVKKDEKLSNVVGVKQNESEKVKLKSVAPVKRKEDVAQSLKPCVAGKMNLKSVKSPGIKDVKGSSVKTAEFKTVKLQSVKSSEKRKEPSPEVVTKPKEIDKVVLKSVHSEETKSGEIKRLKLTTVVQTDRQKTANKVKLNSENSIESKSEELKKVKLRSTKAMLPNDQETPNRKTNLNSNKTLESKSSISEYSVTKSQLKSVGKDVQVTEVEVRKTNTKSPETKEETTAEETNRRTHRRASEPRINKINYMKQMFESKGEKVSRSRSAERPTISNKITSRQTSATDDFINIRHETKSNKLVTNLEVMSEETITQQTSKNSPIKETTTSTLHPQREVKNNSVSLTPPLMAKQTERKENTSTQDELKVGVNIKSKQSTPSQKEINKNSSEQKEAQTAQKIENQKNVKQHTTVKKETVTRSVKEVTQTNSGQRIVSQGEGTGNKTVKREVTQNISNRTQIIENTIKEREVTQNVGQKQIIGNTVKEREVTQNIGQKQIIGNTVKEREVTQNIGQKQIIGNTVKEREVTQNVDGQKQIIGSTIKEREVTQKVSNQKQRSGDKTMTREISRNVTSEREVTQSTSRQTISEQSKIVRTDVNKNTQKETKQLEKKKQATTSTMNTEQKYTEVRKIKTVEVDKKTTQEVRSGKLGGQGETVSRSTAAKTESVVQRAVQNREVSTQKAQAESKPKTLPPGSVKPVSIQQIPVNASSVTSVPVHPSSMTSVPVHPSYMTSVPVHPSSVTSVPVHPSSVTSVPVHPSSVTSVPVHPSSVTSVPVNASSVTSVPVHPSSMTPVTVHSSSVTPVTVHPSSMTPVTVPSSPIQHSPVQTSHVQSMRPSPAQLSSTQPSAPKQITIQPSPAKPNLVQSNIVQTSAVQQKHVTTSSVQSSPVPPNPVMQSPAQSTSVQPRLSQPNRGRISPAQSNLVSPSHGQAIPGQPNPVTQSPTQSNLVSPSHGQAIPGQTNIVTQSPTRSNLVNASHGQATTGQPNIITQSPTHSNLVNVSHGQATPGHTNIVTQSPTQSNLVSPSHGQATPGQTNIVTQSPTQSNLVSPSHGQATPGQTNIVTQSSTQSSSVQSSLSAGNVHQTRSVSPRPGQEYLDVRKAILKNANFEIGDKNVTIGCCLITNSPPDITNTNMFTSSVLTKQNGTISDGMSEDILARSSGGCLSNGGGVYDHGLSNGGCVGGGKDCVKNKDKFGHAINGVFSNNETQDATKPGGYNICPKLPPVSANTLTKYSAKLSMQISKQNFPSLTGVFHRLKYRSTESSASGTRGEAVHKCSQNELDLFKEQNGGARFHSEEDQFDDNPIKTEIKNKINEQIELRNSPKSNRKHKKSSKTKVTNQTKLIESSQPNIRSPITFSNSVARRHGSTSPSRTAMPVAEPEVSIRSRSELFPFRRKFAFEDLAFMLCLLTFSALWIGMPSLTFVLLVVTIEFLYALLFAIGLSD